MQVANECQAAGIAVFIYWGKKVSEAFKAVTYKDRSIFFCGDTL